MQGLLRLLLVFLSVVLLDFGTNLSIIAFFITVVTNDHEKVFFRAFRPYFVRGYITFNYQNTKTSVLLLTFLLLKPLFGYILSFFEDLYVAGRIICKLGLLGFWFMLFDSMIFYGSAFGRYFGRGNLSRIITLPGLMVHLPNIGSRLGACFGLSFGHFLDYLFPGIQFSTFFLKWSLY